MKRALKTTTLLLAMIIATFMVSCESFTNNKSIPVDAEEEAGMKNEEPSSVFPTIKQNGVAPFFLDDSIQSIPPRGNYYDNIVLNRYYEVVMGDHVVNLTEKELEEYYDYYWRPDVLKYYGEGVVMQGMDTILIVEYDEKGIINRIEVFSEKLSLENGIHVGLSSETMASEYNAMFLSTDAWAGEAFMCYYIDGLSDNITLLAETKYELFNSNSLCKSSSGGLWPEGGAELNVDDGPIFWILTEKVKDISLSSILIMKNGWECFHQDYFHKYY